MICGCVACLYDCCRRISVCIDAVVAVGVCCCAVLAGSRAVDSADVMVRDAAEVADVCCGVATGRLNVSIAGVVIRDAAEAVCCCAVVDGNRTVDIAAVVVRGVAEVDARVCGAAPVSRAVGVAGVGVRTGRLGAWRFAFLGMGTSGTQGDWVSRDNGFGVASLGI